jgi:hypothetical protein
MIVIVSPTKNVDGDVDRSPLSGPEGDVNVGIEASATATDPIMTPTTAVTVATCLAEILMALFPGGPAWCPPCRSSARMLACRIVEATERIRS